MDDSLEIVTGKVNALWHKTEDYRATIGSLMVQAKALVDAGDDFAEGLDWSRYARQHFLTKDGKARAPRTIRELLQIGSAPDPEAKAQEIRDTTRERITAVRTAAKVNLPPERISQESVIPKPAVGMPQPGEELDDIKRWIVDDLTDDQQDELLIWLDDLVKARRPEPEPAPLASPAATVWPKPVVLPPRSAPTPRPPMGEPRGWYGTKPPVQCNTKDGRCSCLGCKAIGCCQRASA